jgi:polyhydroxyalkanoate synthesis regulator phasin
MRVIIINGSGRVGKDQFTNYVKKHYDGKCLNWSTIDKVKKISKRNFGWGGIKTDEARRFLSEMKRIWSEYNNGPFLDMVKQISNFNSKLNKKDKRNVIYFIHCREPQEIQKFVDKYDEKCTTLLLKRDDRDVPDNLSDKNVNNFNYDFVIQNNGNKKDLEKEAINFLEKIKSL